MQSTRNSLITLLENNTDSCISVDFLTRTLGISESILTKYLKELKDTGYLIKYSPQVGYRVLGDPGEVNAWTLQRDLRTSWLGKTLVHEKTMDSTQKIAHELARSGAEHGTIVMADEQKAGKGRMGRKWHSSKNDGIWLSIILRPHILPYLAPQLTLLTATVIADVIKSHTKLLNPQIKWPNDILINGKKVAGILTEMQVEQNQINYLVIGIGLNVNQLLPSFPTQINQLATSLRLETDQKWSNLTLTQDILAAFEDRFTHYIARGFPDIKRKWENYGYKLGEKIWVKTAKERWQATFLGLSEDGALLIKNSEAEIKPIYSAEIDWFEKET